MANEFDRNLKDATFIVTKALPAAGASNQSDSFNLGGPNTVTPENVEVEIVLPATPSLADSKSVTLTMQDSANDSDFATVDNAPTVVVTGAGSAGAAGVTQRFRLPADVRQYIRWDQAVGSAGGTNTAVSATYQLLF